MTVRFWEASAYPTFRLKLCRGALPKDSPVRAHYHCGRLVSSLWVRISLCGKGISISSFFNSSKISQRRSVSLSPWAIIKPWRGSYTSTSTGSPEWEKRSNSLNAGLPSNRWKATALPGLVWSKRSSQKWCPWKSKLPIHQVTIPPVNGRRRP